jgi:hypothetical protein
MKTDEDDYIYSGYMSWKHGDFGLNPEHPPLVSLVTALSLLHLAVKMPALQSRLFKLEGFLGGREFFSNNDADGMLIRARLAVSFLAVLLALVVFLAARKCLALAPDLWLLHCGHLTRTSWRMARSWEPIPVSLFPLIWRMPMNCGADRRKFTNISDRLQR